MSTSSPIATICDQTLLRLNAELACPLPLLHSIREFAKTLDQDAGELSPLDRIELQNAATEYVLAWIAAETLEQAVADSGGIVTPAHNGKPLRQHPALAQAAAARARMRQVFRAIKTLLKNAAKRKPASTPQRAGQADDSPSVPIHAIRSAVESNPPANRFAEPLTQARANTAYASAPAGAIFPTLNPSTLDPTTTELERPETALDPSSPDAEAIALPFPEDAPEPPIAPPMNRAQRRAQAQLEARTQRRAKRKLRKAQRTSPAASPSA